LTAIELCKIWLKKIRGIEFTEDVPEGFKKGLELVKWPGRGQQLNIKDTKYASTKNNTTWYLDGAHTIESLQVCAEWFQNTMLNQSKGEDVRVLVFNCTHGRDSGNLLRVISDIQSKVHFDHIVLTTNITYRQGYTTDNTNKTVSLQEVTSVQEILAKSWLEQVPGFNKDNVHIVDTIEDAVEFAVDLSKNQQQVNVLTTGSLIMVGNTLTVLGIEPQ
jgi:folylpolyglutamate synthase